MFFRADRGTHQFSKIFFLFPRLVRIDQDLTYTRYYAKYFCRQNAVYTMYSEYRRGVGQNRIYMHHI